MFSNSTRPRVHEADRCADDAAILATASRFVESCGPTDLILASSPVVTLTTDSAAALAASAQRHKTVTFVDSWHDFSGPQVYRDTHSGTLYYVESDGRHVASISRGGKLLWVRDPFKDAHLEPYRTDNPQIISIGEATWWGEGPPPKFRGSVIITYNSSQFGALNRSNGDFQFLGQN